MSPGLRPTDRHPYGPRPAILGGDAHQERGSVALAVWASAIGRDAGRRPVEGPKSLLEPLTLSR